MKIRISDQQTNLKTAEQGAKVSISSYLLLTAMKLLAGFFYQSSSLIADGFNNLTDVVSSAAVLIGLKKAQKPADDDHRYGHWRAETIASLMTSFIMFFVGFEILKDNIQKIFAKNITVPDSKAAIIALISAVIIYGVHLYNKKLSKKANSKGLNAVAQDNLVDSLTSLATAGAVVASALGVVWLDITMAVLVSLIILKTAYEIFSSNAFELSDGFSEDKLTEYAETLEKITGVVHVKTIRGRMYGSYEYLDVTVQVDPHMSIVMAHELADQVEVTLAETHGVAHTHVHIEPLTESIRKRDEHDD